MTDAARRPALYLAGPDVFRPDTLEHGARLKAACAAAGATGLYPMDNEIHDAEDVPGAIRTANMEMIRRCDAVLANMTPFRGPSMDPGTAYEMGAAAALGKPVIGYTADARSYVERMSDWGRVPGDGPAVDADGLSIEDFGVPLADNLMMARGVSGLFRTFDEALAHAVALLSAD